MSILFRQLKANYTKILSVYSYIIRCIFHNSNLYIKYISILQYIYYLYTVNINLHKKI